MVIGVQRRDQAAVDGVDQVLDVVGGPGGLRVGMQHGAGALEDGGERPLTSWKTASRLALRRCG
jgi:hypothetical protein